MADLMGDPSLERVLNGIESSLRELNHTMQDLDSKLDYVQLNYVRKEDYASDRAMRRSIVMWGIGIIVTIAIATWTLIATRGQGAGHLEELVLIPLLMKGGWSELYQPRASAILGSSYHTGSGSDCPTGDL